MNGRGQADQSRKLVVATGNAGKLREYMAMLGGLPVEVLSLRDFPGMELPPEEEDSYRANALIKARAVATTGLVTLADDSGLEVDALGGQPGVRSARFAGDGAGDEANNLKLLGLLKDVPWERRTARFRCVVALMCPPAPDGRPGMAQVPHGEVVFAGTCEGMITFAPRGGKGFGYDPLFYVPEYGCTMGELNEEVKNRISHRARALAKALPVLAEIFGLRL